MKSLKFILTGLIAMVLSLCVSCSSDGDWNDENSTSGKFGSISISTGSSSSRFLDSDTLNAIESAEITVSGYGMESITVENVAISGGKSSKVEINNIPVGKNRVVTVKALKTINSVLTNIDGMELSAVIPELKSGSETAVTVNWSSTSEGRVYAALVAADYDVTDLSEETVLSYIPSDVKPNLVDTDKIAEDIQAGKSPVTSDYVLNSRSVTFSTDYASSDVAVWVNDNASSKLTSVVSGTNTISGIAPGVHTMYFIFKSENILLEKEVDVSSEDVNIEGSIQLQVTAPRLEDGNGNSISGDDLTFDSAKAVYLECRSYDDEKIPDGITVKYTVDGTDPKSSDTVQTYSSDTGITVSKNTVIKAYSQYSYLYDSDTVTFEPEVRCTSPVLKDADGNVISDPSFTEVTTVYLSADEGASIKYYVDDSEEAVEYDSETGITLSENQTITAVASLDGYADSKSVSFGVNVTLPIGTLTISGTTSSSRRFMESNTISITSDSNIEGLTILYTTDGSTPYIDKYGNQNGKEYTEPFLILADASISAIAYKDGWQDSEVAGPVSFIRATKLTSPVISGETSFVSYTPVTVSFPGTDVNGNEVSAEGVTIYYSTDSSDTTADAIIANGTVYTDAFEITATTYVRAVAVCEDYVTSDITGLQFAITEGVEKLTFTSDPAMDMTGKSCWACIWTEGESDSTWTQATITDEENGVATFNMPTDKTTFLVVVASENTTMPDWTAISYTDETSGETVDMDGRIFYQTDGNGISYYTGTTSYTASFDTDEYDPGSQVKVPVITVDDDGYVTLTSETTAAKIYYTENGTDPVDATGNPLATATLYTEPFELSDGTTLLKVAAYKEHYETSEVKKYSTTGDLDVVWYVGVPATIELPDEDDTTQNRTVTVEGMNIAFDGNGYAWTEVKMTKCESSSTDSVLWYKVTAQFNSIDGSDDSLTTYQPRITVSGQTKTVLYYHGTANGYCNSAVNAEVNLENKVVVIDGTDFSDWNFYTSDTADNSSGSAKYYTQDWTVITDGKVQFTDTDPGYN